jgi:hypothetical protein
VCEEQKCSFRTQRNEKWKDGEKRSSNGQIDDSFFSPDILPPSRPLPFAVVAPILRHNRVYVEYTMYGTGSARDMLTYVASRLGEMNEGEGKVDYIMLLARTAAAAEVGIICEA